MRRSQPGGPLAGLRSTLLASATAAILALTGCSLFPVPDSTSTPTGEDVDPGLAAYYGQSLVWSSCYDDMECATAVAPMDWAAPSDHPDIELALVRHRASGESHGALFVNPGGPGASGVDLIAQNLDYAVSEDLQKNFDVVGWDPRGVGRSSAVDCLDGPQLDEFLFGTPSSEPGTPGYREEVAAQAQPFVAGCEVKTGELLNFIDTASTVRDLDMLRAAVGDEKLNYLGYSYGTDIGTRYVDRYPQRVGRVVLDGAMDPTVSRFDINLAQTKAFADALRAYLADCLEGTDCPFSGSVDDAIGQIDAIFDRLDAAPLRGPDGRELTASYLSTAITSALYDEGTWAYLTTAFAEVGRGESSTAFRLADSYVGRGEDGRYASNFFQAFIAISCIDYPVERDPAVLAEQASQLAAVDPFADEAGATDAEGDVVCQQWPYEFSGTPAAAVTGAGAAPVLVVGTTGDPATPYQWAVSLSEQLQSGHLLTRVGEGHLAYTSGDPCVISAVDAYLIEGTVPEDGARCS